eukprot:Sspe_Gene.42008::Locus_20363_Transcript_1_4_Confidence_0.333_Length_1930::g.42008::m.42008
MSPGDLCVVCGRDDRDGEERHSGFKCLECIGKKSRQHLKKRRQKQLMERGQEKPPAPTEPSSVAESDVPPPRTPPRTPPLPLTPPLPAASEPPPPQVAQPKSPVPSPAKPRLVPGGPGGDVQERRRVGEVAAERPKPATHQPSPPPPPPPPPLPLTSFTRPPPPPQDEPSGEVFRSYNPPLPASPPPRRTTSPLPATTMATAVPLSPPLYSPIPEGSPGSSRPIYPPPPFAYPSKTHEAAFAQPQFPSEPLPRRVYTSPSTPPQRKPRTGPFGGGRGKVKVVTHYHPIPIEDRPPWVSGEADEPPLIEAFETKPRHTNFLKSTARMLLSEDELGALRPPRQSRVEGRPPWNPNWQRLDSISSPPKHLPHSSVRHMSTNRRRALSAKHAAAMDEIDLRAAQLLSGAVSTLEREEGYRSPTNPKDQLDRLQQYLDLGVREALAFDAVEGGVSPPQLLPSHTGMFHSTPPLNPQRVPDEYVDSPSLPPAERERRSYLRDAFLRGRMSYEERLPEERWEPVSVSRISV